MDNFDLRKYLAEGRLLKEDQKYYSLLNDLRDEGLLNKSGISGLQSKFNLSKEKAKEIFDEYLEDLEAEQPDAFDFFMKDLNEGKLLKEWMGINVGGHPRGGTGPSNKFYPKFDKDSLRKALGDADDAFISISGENYIIYNPDSNNQNNADMWIDKSIFAVDKDGEEHEIYYKDIDSIKIK